MSGLIFAKGRTGQAALEDVAAAGATRVALTDANAAFSAGQAFFASEADGSEVEWLGKATVVDATGVTFSRALSKSKNASALVWAAASVLETPAEVSLPITETIQTGVALERTLAGGWIAAQTSLPMTEATITLDGLAPAMARGILAWLEEHAGWGLRAFTLTGAGMEPTIARLAGQGDRAIKREWRAGGRTRLVLPLWIVREGAYQ